MDNDILEDILKGESGKTPSDKVYIAVAVILSIISGVIILAYSLVFLASTTVSNWIWFFGFLPIIILTSISSTMAIKQLLRNLFVSAIITILVNVLVIVAFVLVIVVGSLYRSELFIPFFYRLW